MPVPKHLFGSGAKSVNDSEIKNLPSGTNLYRIIKAGLKKKKDAEEYNVVFDLVCAADGLGYQQYCCIASDTAAAARIEIGQGVVKGIWDACKLGGTPDISRLPNFAEKFIEMRVEHSESNEKGQVFANIRRVDPATKAAFEAALAGTSDTAPAQTEEEEETSQDTEEEEATGDTAGGDEEEEIDVTVVQEEAPSAAAAKPAAPAAPAAPATARRWGATKK